MRRREFITLVGGAAAGWPRAARAQQANQVRRIGVLMGYASTDPEGQALLAEFTRHLAELGWTEGRNVRIDVRWGGSNVDLLHTFAKELISLQPDVLLATFDPGNCRACPRDANNPDRVLACRRPGRLALRGKPVPSRRQHYWDQR